MVYRAFVALEHLLSKGSLLGRYGKNFVLPSTVIAAAPKRGKVHYHGCRRGFD